MMTRTEVDTLRDHLLATGAPKPEIIQQLAESCLGWPYVFGAWGEICSPSNRKKRARSDHPTIVRKCPALNGRSCSDCQWGIGVRQFDCRGFTRWLIQQTGLDITGQGATSQYNTAANWTRRGPISEMPDCVCCVFKQKGSTMEHTGIHVGGGRIIHCSVNVQTGRTSDKGWTHYAIPAGLYEEGAIPVTNVKPTLRRGAQGDLVTELQKKLKDLGYDCGKIDGIYGTKTFNAVVQFQTAAKLNADGVCGPKTWAALDSCTVPPETGAETYRVTIEGVTYEQYRKILEICPLAEASKE